LRTRGAVAHEAQPWSGPVVVVGRAAQHGGNKAVSEVVGVLQVSGKQGRRGGRQEAERWTEAATADPRSASGRCAGELHETL
jgi:hypothetical protein